MSLDQILGLSYEIKILDFLLSNSDFSYTIEDLQDFTGIDTGIIRYMLPKLEYNGLVENNNEVIGIAKNKITYHLMDAVFSNSMLISTYPEGVTENNFMEWKNK